MDHRKRPTKATRRMRAWLPGVAVAVIVAMTAGLAVAATKHVTTDPVADEKLATAAEEQRLDLIRQRIKDNQRAYEKRALVKIPKDRPLQIYYLGDSITAGSYASDESLMWRELVDADLDKRGAVESKFEGTSGITAERMLKRVNDEKYDLVIVALGTNDWRFMGADEFQTDLDKLLARLRKSSPEATLMCLSPWVDVHSETRPFFPATEAACKKHDGAYVPAIETRTSENRAAKGDPYFGGTASDSGHPNDRGHAALADMVLKSMRWTKEYPLNESLKAQLKR